jgi:XTP/dITP diphosphohydrolase
MLLQSNFVVIATRNQGKVKEFAELLGAKGYKVRSLNDYSDLPDIIENGATFAENARIKAQTISAYLHIPVLADDSGLCVDALQGEPGVYSARYAGDQATDAENNTKLLEELRRVSSTNSSLQSMDGPETAISSPVLLSPASFQCALALVDPVSNHVIESEASCAGYIINECRGNEGFGYDPLFYLPAMGKTMAELTLDEKNKVSHRALALREFLQNLSYRE